MIQFILSLIRYPHTPGMTKLTCDTKAEMSYVDLLVEEGLNRDAKTAPKEAPAPAQSKVVPPKATRGGSNRTRRNKLKVRFTLKNSPPLEHQQDHARK